MKHKLAKLNLLVILFLSICFSLKAQIYPVQVNVRLVPPYSVYLADYATNGQLQVLILQRDLTEPSYELRLHMEVQLGGSVIMRTSRHFSPPPIRVEPGQPVLLNATDILPYFDPNNIEFSGYSRSRYEQTKSLPEGAYTISFTAYDYYRPDVAVSLPGQSFYFLAKVEPPLLNMPYNGQQLSADPGRVTLFQWMPRGMGSLNSALSTAYRLELFEIRPEGQSPQVVAQNSQPIFSTITEQNQYLYTPADPPLDPDMRYAWRVQAFDQDGRDAFANKGYSEVFNFYYGNVAGEIPTLDPLELKAEATSTYAAHASWTKGNYDSYTFTYRKPGSNNEWFSTTTSDTTLAIGQLEENTAYECRVQGLYQGHEGPYSTLVNFRTPARIIHQCGDPATIEGVEKGNPLQSLTPNMLVRVGLFIMRVTEASGSGGTFTGKGEVFIPFIQGAAISVTFNNVYINTLLELTKGQVTAESEPIEEWLAKQLGGLTSNGRPASNANPDFVIRGPEDISVTNPDGSPFIPPAADSNEPTPAVIVIKDEDGNEHTYKVDDLPATITDSEGNTYEVGRDGKAKQVSTAAPQHVSDAQKQNLNLTNAKVVFNPVSQLAFDSFNPDYGGDYKKEFAELSDRGGSDKYYVPFQLAEARKSVEVEAVLTLNNNKLDMAKLSFITGADQKLIPKSVQGSGSTYTYSLSIPAMDNNSELDVYAIMTPAEGQHYSIGQLKVVSYSRKKHKVVLVPVGKDAKYSADAGYIQQRLNKLYTPYALEFNVSMAASFDDPNRDWKKEPMVVTGSGMFATLTSDMKKLKDVYSQTNTIEPDAAYLFILPRADSTTIGDMPRSKPFGYLFDDVIKSSGTDYGWLVAHELGHGLFTLRHSWNYTNGDKDKLKDNLMNYHSGNRLTKYQWHLLHNPEVAWDAWKSDEEGMAIYVFLDKELQPLPKDIEGYALLTPSGIPVHISGLEEVSFNEEGALLNFKKDGEYYSAIVQRQDDVVFFYGYISRDNAKTIWLDTKKAIDFKKYQNEVDKLRFTDYNIAQLSDKVYAKGRLYNNGKLHECIVEAKWVNKITYNNNDKFKQNRQLPIIPLDAEMIGAENCHGLIYEVKEGQGQTIFNKLAVKIPEDKLQDFVKLCNKISDESPVYCIKHEDKYIDITYSESRIIDYIYENNLFNYDSFVKKLPKQNPTKDYKNIYSEVDLWEDISEGYNVFSVDWTSYNVPFITTEEQLFDELDNIVDIVEIIRETDANAISTISYNNIMAYVEACVDDPDIALESKFHLNETIKMIYNYLGLYSEYSYSFRDLVVRKRLEEVKGDRFIEQVRQLEARGGAAPVSGTDEYKQYVARHGTESAYFLGQQYEGMMGIMYAVYGLTHTTRMVGDTFWQYVQHRGQMRTASTRCKSIEFRKAIKQGKIVAFDRSIVGKTINTNKQAEHIDGTKQRAIRMTDKNEYPSILREDAQTLLNEFKSGKGTVVDYKSARKSIIVRFDRVINGVVLDEHTGAVLNNTPNHISIKIKPTNTHIYPVNYATNNN